MVNSKGERFANEALAYDQFGETMRRVDPETGEMPNATAWLIFDQNYWDKFGIFGVTPGGEAPDYLYRAASLSKLAAQIGVVTRGCCVRSTSSTRTPPKRATRNSAAVTPSSTDTLARTTRVLARRLPTLGSPRSLRRRAT